MCYWSVKMVSWHKNPGESAKLGLRKYSFKKRLVKKIVYLSSYSIRLTSLFVFADKGFHIRCKTLIVKEKFLENYTIKTLKYSY